MEILIDTKMAVKSALHSSENEAVMYVTSQVILCYLRQTESYWTQCTRKIFTVMAVSQQLL